MLQKILEVINSIPVEAWETLGSAFLVSPLAVGFKKWWKVNSEKLMMFIVLFSSVGSAALWYLTETQSQSSWFIAVQGMLVFATTQPVYFLAVKPFIRKFKLWWHEQIVKTAEYDAQVKSAVVEPTVATQDTSYGGQVLSTQVQNADVQDFSH